MVERTYRLGISAASSQITRFGQNHGVTINLDYQGGQRFYNYVVKQQSKLSVIHVDHGAPPIAIWQWVGFKNFVKGLLDSVESDWNSYGEVCKVYVTLNPMTGLDHTYKGVLEDFFWAIGTSRKGFLGLGLRGEYIQWGEQTPPTNFGEMMVLLQPVMDIVHKYGYKFGATGMGGFLSKYLSPSDVDRVLAELDWITRDIWFPYRSGVDDQEGLTKTYNDFKGKMLGLPTQTNVIGVYAYLENTARGAEDGVSPWYLTADTFHYMLQALDEVYQQRPELLKYGVVIPFSHYTYNDAVGWTGHSSTIKWLFSDPNLVDLHNVRTSDYPTARETYPVVTVENPFPPYPTSVFAGAPHPPPPFAVKPNQAFPMSAYAIRLLDGQGLIGETIDFYARSPLGQDIHIGSETARGVWINPDIIPNCVIPDTGIFGRYTVYAKYNGGALYLPSSGGAYIEPILVVSETNLTKFDSVDSLGQHFPLEKGELDEEAYREFILWLEGNNLEKIVGIGDQGKAPPFNGYLPVYAPNAYPDTPNPVNFRFKILFPTSVIVEGKVYNVVRVYDNQGKEYTLIPNLLYGNREYGHMPGIDNYVADVPRTIIGEYALSTAVHTLNITSTPIPVTVEINPL